MINRWQDPRKMSKRMNSHKIIINASIAIMVGVFYGCGGTVVEIMKEQITEQLEEPKVVETVEDSAKWEQNKVESTKRYAIWDNWRDQNYEYQFNDKELKVRLSTEFRSDYFMGEGVGWSIDDKISQISQFELMIQNKTDRPFTLFVDQQDFIF